MLLCFQRPSTAGSRLNSCLLSFRVHSYASNHGLQPSVKLVASLRQNISRQRTATTTAPRQGQFGNGLPKTVGNLDFGDTRRTHSSGPDDGSRVNYLKTDHVDNQRGPLSFFDLFSLTEKSLTHVKLREQAGALFPDSRRQWSISQSLLPDLYNLGNAVATHDTIELATHDALDLPRQLLAAQVLSTCLKLPLVTSKDWARSLFKIAIELYRVVDAPLSPQDFKFYSICYQQYARMLDLLQLWNVFFQINQRADPDDDSPLRTVIDHAANKIVQNSSYQHRLLAFAPEWPPGSDSLSDQYIVCSSLITLTIMVKVRRRMLSGIDSNTSSRGASAAPGSFLNIRNVSPPEAVFMHIVGRAAQSAPLNRIYLRVGLSQLNLSPEESQSFGRTLETLHSHHEYLITEAERCLSSIETFRRMADPTLDYLENTGPLHTQDMANEPIQQSFDFRDLSTAPVTFLVWIQGAKPDELRTFAQAFRRSTRDSIVEAGECILDAVARRMLFHIQQTKPTSGTYKRVLHELLLHLKMWFSISASRPSENLFKTLLSHLRAKMDMIGYVDVWTALLRFNRRDVLLDDVQSWITDLHRKDYLGATIQINRAVLTVISREERSAGPWLASTFTHACLSLCISGKAQQDLARRYFGSFLKAGFKPDRSIWRLWMRLSLLEGSAKGFASAVSKYRDLPGAVVPFDEEMWLWFKAQLKRRFLWDMRQSTGQIMTIIAQGVALWNGEMTEESRHFEDFPSFAHHDAWEDLVKAHSYLVAKVCDTDSIPNKLKVAACIHKHLLYYVPVSNLPEELTFEMVAIKTRISQTFSASHIDEQLMFLSRHLYTTEQEGRVILLPIVESERLTTKWIARRLRERHLSYDLGSKPFSDLGSHLEHLLAEASKPSLADAATVLPKTITKATAALARRPKQDSEVGRLDPLELFRERLKDVRSIERGEYVRGHASLSVLQPPQRSRGWGTFGRPGGSR